MLSGSNFNSARLTITIESEHDFDACAWFIYLEQHSKNNYKKKPERKTFILIINYRHYNILMAP
jgi:hypothetical protein